MLARRFTIVVLLLTLFGMGFSILVAEISRSGRAWRVGMVVPCDFDNGRECTPPVTQ
jgi:hypothetical protein